MDEPDRAHRQRDRDTGTDQHPLSRLQDDILGGAQVHARIAVVGATGHGNPRIQPEQWYR